ncbi:MAG: hypothetical protein ABWY55_04220 [Microbacterium sp.]
MSTPETPPAVPVRDNRFSRLRAATDRVPTKWFVSGLTGVFLVATAAFGGMADAVSPDPATLAIGETRTTAQLSIEVRDVVVIDALPEFSMTPEPGHRAVAVLAYVTNEWTEPQRASPDGNGLRDTLRIGLEGMDDAAPVEIARIDDNTSRPVLQPGLRVPLAFVWSVPDDLIVDGQSIEVRVFDQTLYTASVTVSGQWWDDPTLAATLDADVTDLGTGEDAS